MQAEHPKTKREHVIELSERGMKPKEIAEETGSTISSVYTYLYKNRKKNSHIDQTKEPKGDPYAEQWEAEQAAKEEAESGDSYKQRFDRLREKYQKICDDYETMETERDQALQALDELKEQPASALSDEQVIILKQKNKQLEKEKQEIQHQLEHAIAANNQKKSVQGEWKEKYEASAKLLKLHL